ncbi:MAG: hypothetical protein AB1665_08795 [Candidatus Thermoplasmatota archaeon]
MPTKRGQKGSGAQGCRDNISSSRAKDPHTNGTKGSEAKTSIQISPGLRDRLWRLKFRKSYEEFLTELCELYEAQQAEAERP